jgi:hypothetical protein
VLWIHIGLNADPDLDLDTALISKRIRIQGTEPNADPDPGYKKMNFYMKNMLTV